MKKIWLSVILPTYNEAENIDPLIKDIYKKFSAVKDKVEVIVVDDNSPDKTADIAKKLVKKYPNLKVIKRLSDNGLTQSIRAGIKEAAGTFVSWMDADFSHPPEILKQMSELVPKNGAIIASRYFKNGKDSRQEKTAVLMSKIINTLGYFLISKKVTDYTSGFIIIEKNVLKKMNINDGYGEYFISLVKQLIKFKVSIVEYPFVSYSRTKGSSKTASNFGDFCKRGPAYLVSLIKK